MVKYEENEEKFDKNLRKNPKRGFPIPHVRYFYRGNSWLEKSHFEAILTRHWERVLNQVSKTFILPYK